MITLSDQDYADLLWYHDAYKDLNFRRNMAEINAEMFRIQTHQSLWDKPIPVIPRGKNDYA